VDAAPSEAAPGALPVEPAASGGFGDATGETGDADPPSVGSAAERFDSTRAMSLAAAASDDSEASSFRFPGPRLPGQARMPLTVWRRACWRTLEPQVTAYASGFQDARGRWIGELAPGWFARTLRRAFDERTAASAS
jgi:hypothetical protein